MVLYSFFSLSRKTASKTMNRKQDSVDKSPGSCTNKEQLHFAPGCFIMEVWNKLKQTKERAFRRKHPKHMRRIGLQNIQNKSRDLEHILQTGSIQVRMSISRTIPKIKNTICRPLCESQRVKDSLHLVFILRKYQACKIKKLYYINPPINTPTHLNPPHPTP
jgi:hypothetical protein